MKLVILPHCKSTHLCSKILGISSSAPYRVFLRMNHLPLLTTSPPSGGSLTFPGMLYLLPWL